MGVVARYQDIMISKILLQKFNFGELEHTEQAVDKELICAKIVVLNL